MTQPSSGDPAPVLSYPEAERLVSGYAGALRDSLKKSPERVPLLDALGRVLAQDLSADRDQPPFPRSTRDGFAGRALAFESGRALPVVGILRAGEPQPTAPLAENEAIEIMTGAAVPPGADAVLMVEHARYDAAARTVAVGPARSLQAGDHIVPRGAETQAGRAVLHAGTRLHSQHIAAAAACGAATLHVCRRPRIAILATGDELVELDAAPLPYQIRNSNSYALAAQVALDGGIPERLPIVPDTRAALDAALDDALGAPAPGGSAHGGAPGSCDLLLLSGGVSMGKYDLVEEALARRGARFFFTGVQIQPGRPAVFGELPRDGTPAQPTPFLGLPGNPVSTMVTYHLFAAPLLRALGGETQTLPRFSQARLTETFHSRPGLTRFLPAFVESTWEGSSVTPIAWQGSGDLAATARANCFFVVPADSETLSSGTTVSVLLAS